MLSNVLWLRAPTGKVGTYQTNLVPNKTPPTQKRKQKVSWITECHAACWDHGKRCQDDSFSFPQLLVLHNLHGKPAWETKLRERVGGSPTELGRKKVLLEDRHRGQGSGAWISPGERWEDAPRTTLSRVPSELICPREGNSGYVMRTRCRVINDPWDGEEEDDLNVDSWVFSCSGKCERGK